MANYSSVNGEIKLILLSTADSSSNHTSILGIIRAMAGLHKTVFVWCQDLEQRLALHDYLKKERIQFTLAEGLDELHIGTDECILFTPSKSEMIDFKIWTRDYLLLNFKEEGLEVHDTAESDEVIFKQVGRLNFKGPISNTSINNNIIPQEGGNIFFIDDIILTGSDAGFDESAFLLKIKKSGLGTYSKVLNLITYGEELYHIDLFLTPTGLIYYDKKIIFIGMPVCLDPTNYSKTSELRTKVLQFRDTLLKSNLFEVIPIPLPFESTQSKTRFYSYNNCLVEVFKDTKKVWLPLFSSEMQSQDYRQKLFIYEREIEIEWEKLGFEVRFVKGNFSLLSGQRGGLHCITNEVRLK